MIKIFQDGGFIILPHDEKLYFHIIKDINLGWWYIGFSVKNDFLFTLTNLDKRVLCKKLLGYNLPGGIWPYTKTKQDSLKLLYYLDSYITNNNKHFIYLCM